MTTSGGDDDIEESIRKLKQKVDDADELLDAEKRLTQASRLVERVIKRHFLTRPVKKPGLRTLVGIRRNALGPKRFADAAYAVSIRNRISHDSIEGEPTDEEMLKASDVFIELVRWHIRKLEQRIKSSATDDAAIAERGSESTEVDVDPPVAPTTASKEPPKFATSIKSSSMPVLDAVESDPWLSASTIAEFTFCPRAGVLTHEGGYSDAEEEMPSTSLLPWYELDAIEEKLAESTRRLFWMVVAFVVGLAIALASPLVALSAFPLILIGASCVWTYFVALEFAVWRTLSQRRLAALTAGECEPDPNSIRNQEVDWWGLLRAGFEVRRPREALEDKDWRVSGKPRRILQKGSITVPVHRIRKSEGPIKLQHIIRVMAHCHLIETTEGASCPYAIILFGGTYQGVTIPNLRENRDKFYSALARVRSKIKQSDLNEWSPPEPASPSMCSKCAHGCPRPAAMKIKTMVHGEVLEPYLLVGAKGRVYNSSCGDRFRWKPKHERNERLRALE